MTMALSLTVGTELCIPQAAEIQAAWLQALTQVESGQPCVVQLDLSGVEACDSAGLQLLLALKARLEQQGGTLSLESPSAVVREALGIFGLDTDLLSLAGASA